MPRFSGLISSLQRLFIEPPSFIQDVAHRHKARLLNLFLLPMILIFSGVDGFYLAMVPGYSPPWYGYLFLFGAYFLNRSRLYRLASFLVLGMFPTVILVNIALGGAQIPLVTLYYLIPGLILGGILLSIRSLIFFASIEIAVILSMPRVAPSVFPGFGSIVGPFSAMVISAVLVLVSMWFRDRIEMDRQAELRDSEERLRLALDAAKMGTWSWNVETGAVSWSDEIEPMFGLSPGGFDGKYETYLSLVHPDDLPGVRNAIDRALSPGGNDYYVEHRLISGGEIRWLEGRGRVHRNGAGKPIRMTGTVVDITDRKRAEQTLREHDERFSKVFRVIPVAMSITTLKDGRLIEANDAYWKLTGFQREAAMGRTVVELGFWNSHEERESLVARICEQGSLQNPSYEFVNKLGERHAAIAFYELLDQEREPLILSMFYDITEQVRSQQALQRSEARTRALLDAIPDMLFEFDREGTILEFIPSSTLDPLMPPDEFLGRNISLVMPPEVVEQTMFAIQRALDTDQLHIFEYPLTFDGRRRYFEARVVKHDTDRVIAMVREVTLRKWVEAERENMIEELESKNAELERFTYTVSHDLKSPLITIKGFLGYLKEDIHSGDRNRLEKDMARIEGAADRMQHLLNDLLELSRVGRLVNKSENVRFDELAHEALELVHGRIAQSGIAVLVQEDLPSVFVDRQRILEVLQNLLDNAAKFTKDQREPRIEIGQRGERNGMPVFYVRDNGIGIAPEFQDRIFGLFNKLDPMSEGTGIGLALVKRIVEFHGGRIWVESEPGRGAAFFFTLPQLPSAS